MNDGIQRDRFEFGKNWNRFLGVLDEDRILEAERSLKKMLEVKTLEGRSFLDIGSGSGLFSLAARRLGAKVHSFDYDSLSVSCTKELKRRYFPDDENWNVEEGNVLDGNYLKNLGQFDIVYSWGVLHHTGMMWQALEGVVSLVAIGGMLFVSIYNDQGLASRLWATLKRFYVHSSRPVKLIIVLSVGVYFETRLAIKRLIERQNPLPFKEWTDMRKNRGMSAWHDLVDWVGGYPFQVAKPEEIFDFYQEKGFHLVRLKTCAGGRGCNEFVFIKENQIKNSCSVR